MKKLLICLVLILALCLPAMSTAEDIAPCGKSFKVTINKETYTMSFNQGSFGPGCAGEATLMWSGKSLAFPFYTRHIPFVTVQGLGDFVLEGTSLILMSPSDIILTEF